MEEVLKEAYYDPATGYVSADKLYKKLKPEHKELTLKIVKEFVKNQSTNQIHAEVKKDPKQINQILALGVGEVVADILDLSNYKSKNKGFRYVLLIQDIYSRMIFGVPLKSKNGKIVLEAIKSIENEFHKKSYRIKSYAFDMGKEFVNTHFDEYTTQKKVKLFPKNPDVKNSSLATIDRMCRTIRAILERYFTAMKTLNWVDVFQKVLDNINGSINRTIKVKPVDIWNGVEINRQDIRETPERLPIGSRVRIKKRKGAFSKGGNNYSSKVFTISEYSGLGYSLTEKTGKFFGTELLVVNQESEDIDNEIRKRNNEKNVIKRKERRERD
jgi:hypothetical protein